jgi:outer membrane receptor protein involved in Fe transport
VSWNNRRSLLLATWAFAWAMGGSLCAQDALSAVGETSLAGSSARSLGFEHGELVSYLVPEDLQRRVTERAIRAEESPFAGYYAEEEATPEAGPSLGIVGESQDSQEVESRAASNSAEALQDSPNIQTLNIQRRSSIAFDPRVRGYHIGQVFAQGEGIYWNPVRPDLDSMLGRIDPKLIDQITVLPGPYSARYGPGFAFIDADLADTPRYIDGYEAHNRLGYIFKANGPQNYLVDTYYGGNCDYGFIINYTFRNGDNYMAGNGQRIPSTYLANSVTTQLGFQLTEGAKLELRYDFLDQRNTQIPGQFWDLDMLQTNAFAVSLIDDSCCSCWTRMRLDAWHHRTPARGTVRNEPVFQVQERVAEALSVALTPPPPAPPPPPPNVDFNGDTNAQLVSSGGRLEYLFGEQDSMQLTAGVDLRHLRQNIEENFRITNRDPPHNDLLMPFTTYLPSADLFNPGLYAELSLPMAYWWTARLGTRVDYVHTTTDPVRSTLVSLPFPNQLTQDDTLYSVYLMNDLKLTENWLATVGFGQAQRPPTLIERYADGVFVSVLQSGFTRVIGNPPLNPERLWQLDAGLAADYGNTRGAFNAYHSWIIDYITYQGLPVPDPTGARLLHHVATPLATLTGFEARFEQDLSSSWTALAAAHYVEGQDQDLDAPLPGISPLEGVVGLRWHDAEDPDLVGVEFLVRMVDAQNRLGVIRLGSPFLPPVTPSQQAIEQRTPGFTTVNIRGYWNPSDNFRLIAGIENLFDFTYLQHLDLRLPFDDNVSAPTLPFDPAFAYAPGITPYIGVDWSF